MSIGRPAPWLSRPPATAADALLAGALAAALGGARALEVHGIHASGWLGYLPGALAALALAGRRRWPLAVFATTLAAALIAIALLPPTGATSLAVVIAVYTLATLRGWRPAVLAALLAAVALALVRGLLQYRGWSDARTAVEPALVLAALFLGWAVASHRAYVAEIEARAEQAERTREEEARRRVDAERLRIARELHDVLAHGIATINVQAGVAAHVLRDRPEHAEQALRTIKATSKEALRELRGILGLLREAGEEPQPRAPAPGLGQLDALIASTANAGLRARVVVDGERRTLPPSVDVAAYRIVQESLTNVLRHAGRARAQVTIAYGEGLVTITVEDDGRAAPLADGAARVANGAAPASYGAAPASDGATPAINGATPATSGATAANGEASAANGPAANAGAGHGIVGMRERAHALGGELQASRRADGGFRVCARLPLASGSS